MDNIPDSSREEGLTHHHPPTAKAPFQEVGGGQGRPRTGGGDGVPYWTLPCMCRMGPNKVRQEWAHCMSEPAFIDLWGLPETDAPRPSSLWNIWVTLDCQEWPARPFGVTVHSTERTDGGGLMGLPGSLIPLLTSSEGSSVT